MKCLRTIGILILSVVCALVAVVAFYVWQLHFWIPAGRVFAVGKWNFDGYEFQVWQRKNRYFTEPFADGLFVRRGTNAWEAFCFDIQDNYLPQIRLTESGGKVQVFRDGENRGEYDTRNQVFKRHGAAYDPQLIVGDPPGNWRLGR